MLVHIVLFWLKKDLSAEDKALFLSGVNCLSGIGTLKGFHVGSPAATTKRPSIDDSYDFGLYTNFANLDGHNSYQTDAIHLKFLEECKHLWESVKVYDFQ